MAVPKFLLEERNAISRYMSDVVKNVNQNLIVSSWSINSQDHIWKLQIIGLNVRKLIQIPISEVEIQSFSQNSQVREDLSDRVRTYVLEGITHSR